MQAWPKRKAHQQSKFRTAQKIGIAQFPAPGQVQHGQLAIPHAPTSQTDYFRHLQTANHFGRAHDSARTLISTTWKKGAESSLPELGVDGNQAFLVDNFYRWLPGTAVPMIGGQFLMGSWACSWGAIEMVKKRKTRRRTEVVRFFVWKWFSTVLPRGPASSRCQIGVMNMSVYDTTTPCPYSTARH